ncbi:hypothetical protein D7D52_16320 [Nocardia yunnanensis]|uniref:Uncharacterized protein n=1 Tax=Nocardia yunnanensis TaxID=2382165 RepID=A0A386ZC34_9NOCA|nr:hypothetical protein D7D52_16320 [Nocardia yunnanensis]
MAFEFRVGDIIDMSCPFTPTRVHAVRDDEIVVEWPWPTADPDSAGAGENGLVGLPAGPRTPGWDRELFRIRPRPGDLAAGDECQVGIPSILIRVIAVRPLEPTRATGRRPRPRREIEYLPAGPPLTAPASAVFDPDDGIPRVLELRFRPYAFLEPGDEVADARARVWRFETAWEWRPFDGRAGEAPTWPLMLLTRHGDSGDDSAAVDVGEATQTGSHHEELAQWAELAGLDAGPDGEAELDRHTGFADDTGLADDVGFDPEPDTDLLDTDLGGESDFDGEPVPAEPAD